MRGEEMDELFAGYAGIYGDRLFAFESSANPKGFPFFTGRDQRQMIRYRAERRGVKPLCFPDLMSGLRHDVRRKERILTHFGWHY